MSDQVAVATPVDATNDSPVEAPETLTDTQAVKDEAVSIDDLRKVRSEAQSLRKRLKDAEARVSEFETANQTDDEKRTRELTALQERADRAEQALRKANGRTAVHAKAGNAVSAEALYRYVKDDIEYGDDGEPTNIDDLVTSARESEPSLFHRGSADGAPQGAPKPTDLNAAFRQLRDISKRA